MSILTRPPRAAAAASALLTFCARAALADPGVVRVRTPAGEVHADGRGMPHDVFDKDPSGVSVCEGECAVSWPPLMATADPKAADDFSPIRRSDGSMQWELNGKPLTCVSRTRSPAT